MKNIVFLKRIFHRDKWRIAIFFDFDQNLKNLVTSVPGSAFSSTHRCFYVDDSEESGSGQESDKRSGCKVIWYGVWGMRFGAMLRAKGLGLRAQSAQLRVVRPSRLDVFLFRSYSDPVPADFEFRDLSLEAVKSHFGDS